MNYPNTNYDYPSEDINVTARKIIEREIEDLVRNSIDEEAPLIKAVDRAISIVEFGDDSIRKELE